MEPFNEFGVAFYKPTNHLLHLVGRMFDYCSIRTENLSAEDHRENIKGIIVRPCKDPNCPSFGRSRGAMLLENDVDALRAYARQKREGKSNTENT